MFQAILVPLDGSETAEQALPAARALAERRELPVQLLACIADGAATSNAVMEETELARQYLEGVAKRHFPASIRVSSHVAHGDDAVRHIREAAAATPGTVVVMTTHGRGGLGRFLLGSVTERMLENLACPLLVVHAQAPGATPPAFVVERVIVPVDGSELAEQALVPGRDLATAFGTKLLLVEVLGADVGFYLDQPGFGGAARDSAEALEARAHDYLAALAERLGATGTASIETQVLHGSAAATLLDHLAGSSTQLVVMTSHGRGTLGRAVLGSVAARLVRHGAGPVLVMPTGTGSAGET